MWRVILFLCGVGVAACSAPVAPPAELSGEVIAFGGGPGGARDACFTCHGLKGEGDGKTPALAGLSSGYLVKQLEDYAGRWRDEFSMSPIASRLSDADRLAVAGYYAQLDLTARGSADDAHARQLFLQGDPDRDLQPCADCHSPGGKSFGLAAPQLAGQTPDYIREQLLAWKQSRRRNDPRDVMGAIARKLSTAEIDSLAAYAVASP
jgi:cytochrome c553